MLLEVFQSNRFKATGTLWLNQNKINESFVSLILLKIEVASKGAIQ